MSRDRERLADCLAHIPEAIEWIAGYTRNMDRIVFPENRLVQDAVIRNIEVSGEASNNVEQRYPGFAAAHPKLPLAIAYQVRNVVAARLFHGGLRGRLENDLTELPIL